MKVPGATRQRPRLGWIEDIRIFAAALVVFLHATFAYTPAYQPGTWWFVIDPAQAPGLHAWAALLRALALNLFLFVAGYLAPGTIDRHGVGPFMKDRLVRLGIPLAIGFLFVFPVVMYAYYVNFRGYPPIDFGTYLLQIYFGIGGHRPPDWTGPHWPDHQFGHLWFLQALLVYSALYAFWRRFRPQRSVLSLALPGFAAAALVVLIVAQITFYIRIDEPLHYWKAGLGFIQMQPGDTPSEAASFVLGVLAGVNGWVDRVSARTGRTCLAAGILASVAYLAAEWSGLGVFVAGGASLHAWLFANAEIALTALLGLGLVIWLRDHSEPVSAWRKLLAANSYGIYLVHLPILLALQYALGPAPFGAVAKWLLVFALTVPLATLASVALRRIPAVRRVI